MLAASLSAKNSQAPDCCIAAAMRLCCQQQVCLNGADTVTCWHVLQVSERIISDGRLLSKSLAADVERITREKQVAQERAETTKVCLLNNWQSTSRLTDVQTCGAPLGPCMDIH